jgi:Dynamin family
MPVFVDLRAATLRLFSELSGIAESREAGEAVERLAAGRQRLLDERLVVVICGEFKRGKSSLLNALLEEPDLFPVDAFYATSLITMAGYGPEENVSVTLAAEHGGLRRLNIDRNEIASYATESENPRNVKRAQFVSIETPNQRLANGLTFVDTPGVGGPFDQHSVVTLGFLENASAVIFVADATQPLLDSELDFIRRAAASARITDDAAGNLFVLTKIDAVDDFEEILANTRAKIAEVTGWPMASIPIVPVSSRAKLDYLKDGSAESLELSNFPALEQVLWASLAQRKGRALLGAALADLDRAARALLIPVETDMRALLIGDSELAALTVQTQNRATWLTGLYDDKGTWRADLTEQLDRMLHDLQEQGLDELNHLWSRCQTVYLDDDRYVKSPGLLLNQVIADAGAAFGAISELAARHAARALQEFSVVHGLQLRAPEAGRLPDPPLPVTPLLDQVSATGRRRAGLSERWKMAADGGTNAGKVGAGIGLTVGAIVGSAVPVVGTIVGLNVGCLLGFTLGSTVGTLTGYWDAVDEADRKKVALKRERLWSELQGLRRAQETSMAESLADLVVDYTTAAIAEIENRIAQEREGVDEAVTRLEATRARVERAADVRRAELVAERRPLDEVLDKIGSLSTRIAALDGRGG